MAFWKRRNDSELLEPVSVLELGPGAQLASLAMAPRTAASSAVAPSAAEANSSAPISNVRVEDPRQPKARTYCKRISFVGNTYRFMAYQASRCPWTVEVSEDGVNWAVLPLEPEGAAPDSDLVDPSAEYAWDVMRTIQPERGSQSDMSNQMVYLDDTIGEWYIIDVSASDRIAFIIRDTQLCAPARKGQPKGPWLIQDVEGGKVSKGTARLVDASRVYRHWQEDANSPLMATSSLIGLVEDIDTYWSLIRHLKREIRSRLGMNRAFWTPTAAHDQKIIGPDGKPISKFNYDWALTVSKAINDQDDSFIESFAPFLIHTPGDQAVPQMIDMGVLGQELLEYIVDARTQVASSLPLSTSFILDSSDQSDNHWGEWLADDRDEETIRARLQRSLNTVTERIYRPAIRYGAQSGFYRGDPSLIRIGFDSTVIRRQLDNSKNAQWALLHGLIKIEVALRDMHYSEADMPDETELVALRELADAFWTTRRTTDTNGPNPDATALPSGEKAVPGNGDPSSALAALDAFIDDEHLLHLS